MSSLFFRFSHFLAMDDALLDPEVDDAPYLFLVRITLARRFTMVSPDCLPSVPKAVRHITQVPSRDEHRLARVAQVGNRDSVTGQLGQVNVVDAAHSVIPGPIGVHRMLCGRVEA